jgi:Raf kinase inhibitor-like YbhB/YbcL family protein
MRLTTAAFQTGGQIPVEHTCDGSDVSPALAWEDPPPATKSFALIADDPDAPGGDWVHWVVFNLPAAARGLSGGIPRGADLPSGGRQGRNDFGQRGYGGPCPPRGPAHRYYFKLFALDSMLDLSADVTKGDLLMAMEDHILAQAELTGRYQRRAGGPR